MLEGWSSGDFAVNRGYEALRPVLAYIENKYTNSVVSRYDYTVDAVGRRSAATLSGSAFDIGTTGFEYDYNEKGELLGARRGFDEPGGDLVNEQEYQYRYDQIGNRTRSDLGKSNRQFLYTANSVNQYTQRTVPNQFPVLGSVKTTTEEVLVNDVLASRYGRYFSSVVTASNSAAAQYKKVIVDTATASTTGRVFVAQTPEAFSYDLDGNLTQDGRFAYQWNAENRLTDATTLGGLVSTLPRVKVKNTYDHQGRRVKQIIKDFNGTDFDLRETRQFMYDGWNLVGETRTLAAGTVTTNWYVWGLDMSQSIQGAGGVGGLLLGTFGGDSTACYYAFDGNGNVSDLVRGVNGAVRAHYEYDPFGSTIFEDGSFADSNPFRFSAKYWDGDVKLLAYLLRDYNPGMGIWLTRDPLGEFAGNNLARFIMNCPVNYVDAFGLLCIPWFDKVSPWENLGNPYNRRISVDFLFADIAGAIGQCKWKEMVNQIQVRTVTKRQLCCDVCEPPPCKVVEGSSKKESQITDIVISTANTLATRYYSGGDVEEGDWATCRNPYTGGNHFILLGQ